MGSIREKMEKHMFDTVLTYIIIGNARNIWEILKTYGNILGNRGNYWENGGQSLFVCCDFGFWRDGIYDIPTL